ncbi:hypothetical protein VTK26DRAFT_7989 [Humicola hyalothermophila]
MRMFATDDIRKWPGPAAAEQAVGRRSPKRRSIAWKSERKMLRRKEAQVGHRLHVSSGQQRRFANGASVQHRAAGGWPEQDLRPPPGACGCGQESGWLSTSWWGRLFGRSSSSECLAPSHQLRQGVSRRHVRIRSSKLTTIFETEVTHPNFLKAERVSLSIRVLCLLFFLFPFQACLE